MFIFFLKTCTISKSCLGNSTCMIKNVYTLCACTRTLYIGTCSIIGSTCSLIGSTGCYDVDCSKYQPATTAQYQVGLKNCICNSNWQCTYCGVSWRHSDMTSILLEIVTFILEIANFNTITNTICNYNGLDTPNCIYYIQSYCVTAG